MLAEVRAARARRATCSSSTTDPSDGDVRLVEALGVRVLRIHERIGVGGAVRTGLRYAARLGYTLVVRVDGDGQHRAADIDALLDADR